MTYKDKAEAIGTEHGRNAGSWVELTDEARARIAEGESFLSDELGEMSGPLSGEWADGYSIDALLDDVDFPQDQRFEAGGGIEADICDAYETAYWTAFEEEATQ